MIRMLILKWLFPSCDIDMDLDRRNMWNAIHKIKRIQEGERKTQRNTP